ncbi:MAG: putative porin, partial [Bacteroidales bacterium]
WGYKASFNYFLVDNMVMLNQESRPFCVETPINVFQLHLYAPIRIKGFGFDANMYLQYASKSYISVPLFAGKASTFYVFKLFKKKMQLQIGFDMMYTTSYMANGYDPILHQFYYQDQNTTGHYFYLDANITIQVQRIAFFFRAGHFLSGIIGNNYFSTPFYPETARRFNLGITWRFYD